MRAADWWMVGIICLLIAFSAVLAGAETAFSKLTRVHALHLEEQGKRFARFAALITEDPPRYINPVLLAMLATHVLGTALAAALAIKLLHEAGEWVATVVMTVVLFIFAEAAPKTSALQHTDSWVLPLSPFVYWLGVAVYPLTRVLIGIANVIMPGKGLKKGPFMSEQEIRHVVDVAEEEEVIEEQEREMIHSIFEFGDTSVRDVMVPRPDMVVVDSPMSIRETLDLAIRNGYSRIPVHEDDDPDNIVGLVYVKDLIRAMQDGGDGTGTVKDFVRDPYFVPETMKVSDLLRQMQKRKVHMAIVADEYGDVAGLVTMEDLLEEIVGEITDEYDVEEANIVPLSGSLWRVAAKLPIWEFNEKVHSELPEDQEWKTIGGLVASVLGNIPEPGDEVKYHGFLFRVERMTRRRIDTVLVRRVETSDGAA
jgi:CBS domain containing-hemolysin-like protein